MLLTLQTVPQEKPAVLKFLMQHDTGAKDGKGARKLTADEQQALLKEFKGLAACKEAVAKDGLFTLTLAPGMSLKLSELRAAGKKAPVAEGFNQILLNTLKLEGRVTLALAVEKNRDKVKAVLKGGAVEAVEESLDGWTCTIKGPGIDAPGLVKRVCAGCGLDYRLFEILKDITWH